MPPSPATTAASTASRGPTLRTASIDDCDLLADLHARSRASAYRSLLPDAYFDHGLLDESRAHWREKMALLADGSGHVMIAERDGRPIAFVCVIGPDGSGCVYVDNLHAAPEAKRTGAGTALLDAAARWSAGRGASAMHLKVLDGNHDAVAFYTARGWRFVRREADVMGGADIVALRYEKSLP